MQIVIDINDNTYEAIKHEYCVSSPRKGLLKVLWDAIQNGTPLPKGHGDLIDTKGLKASMSCYMMDMTKSFKARYIMSVAKGLVDFQKPLVKADNEEE